MKLSRCAWAKAACILPAAILFCGLGFGQAARQPAEIKAIDALSQVEIAASMHSDVDTLCSLWTDDGVLVLPGTAPLVGKKAICNLLQQQKAKSIGWMTIAYNEQWEEVRLIGDYAWQWGTISQTDAERSGKQKTAELNALRILHRDRDGNWKVARACITPAP
ncbi:MAG TPA: nuclear transport factor 2 family protein [Terriglobales bacterium]|nr:nuclear transport factor 2 family protein [Terriglobales bacterium]